MQLHLPIRALSCPARLEPGVFGIYEPVLLLPEGIADYLPAAQLEMIVAHEVCHVRRRDNLTAAIHMVVEAIFWFHPLVWWIRGRLVEERERACDEEVLRTISDPGTYAEGILNVCKFYLAAPMICVSGITGSALGKRIASIVGESYTKPPEPGPQTDTGYGHDGSDCHTAHDWNRDHTSQPRTVPDGFPRRGVRCGVGQTGRDVEVGRRREQAI